MGALVAALADVLGPLLRTPGGGAWCPLSFAVATEPGLAAPRGAMVALLTATVSRVPGVARHLDGVVPLAAFALGALAASLRGRRRGRRSRRLLAQIARAEHELRSPVAVLRLTCERMSREPAGRRYARLLEIQVERLAAALADLEEVRTGERRPCGRGHASDLRDYAGGALAGWAPALRAAGRRTRLDWKAGRVALGGDRGRVAQAIGNLVANAAEHGVGEVELRGRRVPGGVRMEVRNRLPAEAGGQRRARASRIVAAVHELRARVGVVRGRGAPASGHGLAIASDAARELGGSIEVERGERTFVAAMELPLSEASRRVRERLAAQGETRRAPGRRPRQAPAADRARLPAARRTGPARPPGTPPGGPRPHPRPPGKPPRVNRPAVQPPRRNTSARRR